MKSAYGNLLAVNAPDIAHKQSTEIIVYVPKSYDNEPERHYPVVFFLHGWGSDAGAFERLGGVQAMNKLKDDMQFIMVSVSGGTSDFRNWSDGVTNWEDHILGSISDMVDSKFRVQERSVGRGVYGVSMGGAAALRIAMTHSDQIKCVAAHSAAISPVDFNTLPEWQRTGYLAMEDFGQRYGDPFRPDDWKSANPLHLAQNGDEEILRKPKYYFDVGVDDQLGFADDNAALSSALATRGIPHTFSLRAGKHGASFIEANIDYALRFMSQCMSDINKSPTEQ